MGRPGAFDMGKRWTRRSTCSVRRATTVPRSPRRGAR